MALLSKRLLIFISWTKRYTLQDADDSKNCFISNNVDKVKASSGIHNMVQFTSNTSAGGSRQGTNQLSNGQGDHKQKRIIKTTLLITSCYLICWCPVTFYQTAYNLNLLPLQIGILYALVAVAYMNVLLNPVIYAAHFDVIKKFSGIIVYLLTNRWRWRSRLLRTTQLWLRIYCMGDYPRQNYNHSQ
jgi:hypothetical protein